MFRSASSQLLFAVIRDIFLKSIHPAFVVPLIFFTFFLGGNLLPLCLVVHYGDKAKDYDYNARKKQQSEEIDRILDKLKKSGYNSLTTEEKKSLFDASKK